MFANNLEQRLPPVRGRLTPNAPLAAMSWFRVGGVAEVLFKPEDRDDLIQFIKNCPADIPVTVLGVASNTIIRDGGIPGVVIRMAGALTDIKISANETGTGSVPPITGSVPTIYAEAGVLDLYLAQIALKNNIGGLEFLSGVPGTIGGAIRMNAGAYGGETKDVLVYADVLYRDGTVKQMTPDDMHLTYRHNDLPEDVIFLGGLFKGVPAEPAAIEQKMQEIKTKRGESQPIREKTGGSTFANPPVPPGTDPKEARKAWQLVDQAGCRGLTVGGAQMSPMHANFMINTGTATAADLEKLGEEVRKRVAEKTGIMLRWEIKRVGVCAPESDA